VLMVGGDPVEVERRLRAGRLACPCGGGLSPWGHARERVVRGVGLLRPRRARCGACRVTHVLLAVSCLVRRADAAEVVGAALRAKAAGQGHRRIAARLGRPASTVRGWLRRFTVRAEEIRVGFTVLLHALDPEAPPLVPTGSGFADAVEAIGRAGAAAVVRLSRGCPWEFAARASGGRLLAPGVAAAGVNGGPNTS